MGTTHISLLASTPMEELDNVIGVKFYCSHICGWQLAHSNYTADAQVLCGLACNICVVRSQNAVYFIMCY